MEQTEFSPAVRYAVWALVALLGVGLLCLGVLRYHEERQAAATAWGVATKQDEAAPAQAPEASEGAGTSASGSELVLHVAGAVAQPGVYRLPAGARVEDALAAAGGVTQDGAPEVLNLAARVADGDKIYVPTREEVVAGAGLSPAARGATLGVGDSATSSGTGAGGKVSVNRASEAELQQVNGIGPAIARAIVEYRTKNGPFQSLDDLESVPGIGPKTLEKLKPYLTL